MKTPDKRYTSNLNFIVHAAAVAYVMFAIFCYLPVRAAHSDFKQAVEERIRLASNKERSAEVLKRKVIEEATKLGIPIDASQVEVLSQSDYCQVRLSYERDLRIPPFATTLHYSIDQAVRRF